MCVLQYKYLGVHLTSDSKLDKAIKERNMLWREAIRMMNGILWDQKISKDNKKIIFFWGRVGFKIDYSALEAMNSFIVYKIDDSLSC